MVFSGGLLVGMTDVGEGKRLGVGVGALGGVGVEITLVGTGVLIGWVGFGDKLVGGGGKDVYHCHQSFCALGSIQSIESRIPTLISIPLP